jgi:hypothetical protein
MDLPNALDEDMQAWPTGTHIDQGAFVSVVDVMMRSRAGMYPAEILNPDLHLFATIVPPSTDETKAIALTQEAFPGVRLHAIQLCSFRKKGESLNTQPLYWRFVAESSYFLDEGPESIEEDLKALFVADSFLAGTSEIYFDSAAREMLLDSEAATKEVAVGQLPKTPADEKKFETLITNVKQFNFFESNGAKKPTPALAASSDIDAAYAYFGDPQLLGLGKTDPETTIACFGNQELFGLGAIGTSKWPPKPGVVKTSELFDPAAVGTSKWPPDPGKVGTSKCPSDPGAVGTFERAQDSGGAGSFKRLPDEAVTKEVKSSQVSTLPQKRANPQQAEQGHAQIQQCV